MSATELQSTRVHPRRRPAVKDSLPSLVTDPAPESSKMQLKKGETFHTPTTPSTGKDPLLNVRSLPRRSPTSLETIAASEERMASILERLTLDDTPEDSAPAQEKPPAPRGTLKARIYSDFRTSIMSRRSSMDSADLPSFGDKKVRLESGHESDSGLGTSVSSCDVQSTASDRRVSFDLGSSPRRHLPLSACKQIERHILVPLLKEEKLKPFHSLVRSVPSRIVKKQIVCLRDLEKILLCLAPKHATTCSSYLDFSEYTIQCLHTSVTRLNDRDQRLPTDRPYTNGYFLDLVSQVRRYAAMIHSEYHDAQAAQSYKDSNLPIMTISPKSDPPTLEVQGGLAITGEPVELVVIKDGQRISLAPDESTTYDNPASIKRALESFDHLVEEGDNVEIEIDEGVKRSMARRKKNAPPMDINQKCGMCDRVFKRHCDLTKHEKTHTRPWKCRSVTPCKYIQTGWPTEKERDRHENDKHSIAPALFKCTFGTCTYASKRESNCKQHMEKAHGWLYVRSKNNARGGSKRGSPAEATPTVSDLSTPASKPVDSPSQDFSPPQEYSLSQEYSVAQDYVPSLEFNFNDPVMPSMTDFSLFGGSPVSSANLDAMSTQFQQGDKDGLVPELGLQMTATSMVAENQEFSFNWTGLDGYPAPQYFNNTGVGNHLNNGFNPKLLNYGGYEEVPEMDFFYPGGQDVSLFCPVNEAGQ